MTFTDIFKQSFLQTYSADMSTKTIALNLLIAAVMGFYVFLLYHVITRKSFYNRTFNVSLWVLTVIVAAIIITISSNIVLSLGMVGALSIVRYRTAIKDPMDLVFLFLAIAEGIMCGAGLAIVAFAVAALVTVGILVLNKFPSPKPMKLLTVNADGYDCEEKIMDAVKTNCKKYKVKSRTLSADKLNLVIEFSSEDEAKCVKELAEIEAVTAVSSISHDGEVTF